jgi:hypothetical protein
MADHDRFWKNVDRSGECWEWTGPVRGKGYGYLHVGNWYSRSGQMDAHRYSASIHLPDYSPDLMVCHTCDNKRCVNPAHLFMGTATDNVRDMVAKGRAMWSGRCKRGHDLAVTGVTCNRGRSRRCGICLTEVRNASR